MYLFCPRIPRKPVVLSMWMPPSVSGWIVVNLLTWNSSVTSISGSLVSTLHEKALVWQSYNLFHGKYSCKEFIYLFCSMIILLRNSFYAFCPQIGLTDSGGLIFYLMSQEVSTSFDSLRAFQQTLFWPSYVYIFIYQILFSIQMLLTATNLSLWCLTTLTCFYTFWSLL